MISHLVTWLAQHVFCPVVILNQARFRWFVPLLLITVFAAVWWYGSRSGSQMLV
jgi:D-alanyl-lipoteichoic acid acyltransferase DltB (MBOAT superfamily)